VAMKYKTIKPKRVIKRALEKIEKDVDSSPPKPLAETIKKLREKVEKEEEQKGGTGVDVPAGAKGARTGVFARGSKQEAELIDIYRTEVAYEINKNWAYADQLSGGGKNLVVSIVIKVMPDGQIKDIFFVDRSGNDYLDDSAYKAIVKSSPVKPQPEGLNLPYVELGLRFGPEGVR
jgi:colicin import membrane protein